MPSSGWCYREKSEGDRSHRDAFSMNHRWLYKISKLSIKWLLRYFSLDPSGGPTDRHFHQARCFCGKHIIVWRSSLDQLANRLIKVYVLNPRNGGKQDEFFIKCVVLCLWAVCRHHCFREFQRSWACKTLQVMSSYLRVGQDQIRTNWY